MDTGENFRWAAKRIIFDISMTALVQGVCVCIRIGAMMNHLCTGEAVVTRMKLDIFVLVTTRPIAHSGQFVCISNCVDKLGMDTGQTWVISKGMCNNLSDRHNCNVHTKVYAILYMSY